MSVQGTDEWFAERVGKATASRIAEIVAKTKKSEYSVSRWHYLLEKAMERLTGNSADKYTTASMRWGTAMEDDARAAYESATGVLVTQVGMIPHPRIAMAGASPDSLVGDDGLLEIKCPNSAKHIGTLRIKKPSGEYVTQMQWQLACTGRAWCDFVSYDPRMPDGLDLFVMRINRDDAMIAMLETEVEAFLAEVDALVVELQEMAKTGYSDAKI